MSKGGKGNMSIYKDIQDAFILLPYKYYKLILLVGPIGSGKTQILKKISSDYNYDYINLNLKLSEKLINIPFEERCYYVDDFMEEILFQSKTDVTILDNIEILFSNHLKIDPLKLLKNISRYRKIIASWGGIYVNGILTYAEIGHSEHRKYKKNDLDVIVISIEGGR
ncbi:MAG: hypothetical protein PWP22_1444 [Thermoanaerobacter sp.]|jgi:ABC-type transporter Mla maintaining outer membrane lipid asymmetry ATPase subunit MlaF|nr:hypothetical protein [Thermoanaerobacter sp.]